MVPKLETEVIAVEILLPTFVLILFYFTCGIPLTKFFSVSKTLVSEMSPKYTLMKLIYFWNSKHVTQVSWFYLCFLVLEIVRTMHV